MGKQKSKARSKQEHFHFPGEGRAKMFFSRIDKEKSKINRKYQIGERIICDFPHGDGTSKKRPVLIWGQYFDQHNLLVGFDILPLTTNITQYRPDTFTLSQTGYFN